MTYIVPQCPSYKTMIDENGNEKSAYDQPLRSFNARYIQARIEFNPWKDKNTDFKIQLKVTKPDGNPIYLPNKKVTAEGDITIQKSKKNQSKIIKFHFSTKTAMLCCFCRRVRV